VHLGVDAHHGRAEASADAGAHRQVNGKPLPGSDVSPALDGTMIGTVMTDVHKFSLIAFATLWRRIHTLGLDGQDRHRSAIRSDPAVGRSSGHCAAEKILPPPLD
jgi:hypothetical protein